MCSVLIFLCMFLRLCLMVLLSVSDSSLSLCVCLWMVVCCKFSRVVVEFRVISSYIIYVVI